MAKGSGTTRSVGKSSASEARKLFPSYFQGGANVTTTQYNALSREAKSIVDSVRGMGDGGVDSAIALARNNVDVFEMQYGTNPKSSLIITDFMGHQIHADMQYQHLKDVVKELEKLKK